MQLTEIAKSHEEVREINAELAKERRNSSRAIEQAGRAAEERLAEEV